MRKFIALAFALAMIPAAVGAQSKPTLVVNLFTAAEGVAWPYDMKQLQADTAAQLKVKGAETFDAVTEAPKGAEHVYALRGEIVFWHPGKSRGTPDGRLVVVQNRDTVKIHYWLTDEEGKQVLEHTDTIAFWGDPLLTGDVFHLAQPFADKIAAHLKGSKVFQPAKDGR